jgi:magnesium and cobalt transporter
MNDYPNLTTSKSFIEKLSHLFNGEPRNTEQLIDILKTAGTRGLINQEAMSIVLGALQLSEMHAREIMIPQSQMAVIHLHDDPETIFKIVNESAHSRFPVTGEHHQEVIGILLAKDLLPLASSGKLDKLNIKKLLRPASFVPESKRLNTLLTEFRANRNHMAIVVDEYGGVAGLVTIEDVLEQIVGDIEDEHDLLEDSLFKTVEGENHCIVKALTPLEDFNDYFKTQFDDEFDTIGGFVTHHFGHLPKRNESIRIEDLAFRVLSADNRTIRLLEVKPIENGSALESA